MNTVRKDVDALNIVITVQVSQDDYSSKVENTLKDYRKKVNMPGFRQGKVPFGMIKKMYSSSVKAEEVNKLISESLNNYIHENELNVLGEPLPTKEMDNLDIDWKTATDFEFSFDVALSPAIEITLSKRNALKYYNIDITDEMVAKEVENYASRFGSYVPAEEAEEKDVIKGQMVELDENGNVKEGGINVEGAVLMPSYIKNEEEKAKFIGAKPNSVITFNPTISYEDINEVASLLHIEKEVAENLTSNFNIEISDITRHQKSEINQSLFDKVFGEGIVTSEEDFMSKIKEGVADTYRPDSDYKFNLDAREYILGKLKGIEFPEEFLKRWVLDTNKEMTAEELDKNFDKMLEDLKWQLFVNKIVKEQEIKVEQEDMKAQARIAAKMQFAQYGMNNVPADIVENYVQDMMKKQDSLRQLADTAMNSKVLTYIKETVKLNEENITIEDFNKMFEDNKTA